MAKIGVVSIYDMNNVGNRVQSYALCRALERLGHTPVVIPNQPYPGWTEPTPDGSAPQPVPGSTQESVLDTARRLVASGDWWGLGEKARRMVVMLARVPELRRFTQQNMSVDPRHILAPGDGEQLRDSYDAFVVGSDQVWNPDYRFGCPTDFLRFAHPHQRIAYAASVGRSDLSSGWTAHFREMLTDFGPISVRERTGVELIRPLVDQPVDLTLDPTLLLPADEWHRLADRAPRPSPGPFLATYLLWTGDRPTYRGVAASARRLGLRTRHLMSPGPRPPRFYGVESFLRTIRDAEAVVTDSFHSTLFAILFRTPVRVLSRGPGQDDRIESLLALFGASSAEAFGPSYDPPTAPLVHHPDQVLAGARHRSLAWLGRAIDGAL